MVSGVGPSELVLLIIIGLLILGPERLPRVASQIGRWVGKARRTANQLRYQMEREIALAEIDRTKSKKPDGDRSRSSENSEHSKSGLSEEAPTDGAPAAHARAGDAAARNGEHAAAAAASGSPEAAPGPPEAAPGSPGEPTDATEPGPKPTADDDSKR